jgi:glycosyltransferase involved in cell wall biosynthesis
VPWVNRHGETGLVVEPGDAGALAAAVNRLLADAALRARMGLAGQSRVRQVFTLEAMADATSAVYRDVLSTTPVPTPQRSTDHAEVLE